MRLINRFGRYILDNNKICDEGRKGRKAIVFLILTENTSQVVNFVTGATCTRRQCNVNWWNLNYRQVYLFKKPCQTIGGGLFVWIQGGNVVL